MEAETKHGAGTRILQYPKREAQRGLPPVLLHALGIAVSRKVLES